MVEKVRHVPVDYHGIEILAFGPILATPRNVNETVQPILSMENGTGLSPAPTSRDRRIAVLRTVQVLRDAVSRPVSGGGSTRPIASSLFSTSRKRRDRGGAGHLSLIRSLSRTKQIDFSAGLH
jgi:hypothetical protein